MLELYFYPRAAASPRRFTPCLSLLSLIEPYPIS